MQVSNLGEGFDPNSGIFTAPERGTYQFSIASATARSTVPSVTLLNVLVNGNNEVCTY